MYGILLAVGLLSAVLLFKIICNVKKVDDKTYSFYSLLAIVSIALGILGAALFQAFYDMIELYTTQKILKFEFSGLTFMGGLITGVVSFVLGTFIFAKGQVKRNFFECASYAAPCIVIGHMFGRLGCFCAGCCYGKRTNSFLGMQFPGDPYKVYPTQLFEVIFLAVLLAVMLVLLFKFKIHKPLLPIYGCSYAVYRFLIEFIRGDSRGTFIPGLTPSQFQVILLALAAIALAVLVYRFNIIPFSKAPDPAPNLKKHRAAENAAPESAEHISAPDYGVDTPNDENSQEPHSETGLSEPND